MQLALALGNETPPICAENHPWPSPAIPHCEPPPPPVIPLCGVLGSPALIWGRVGHAACAKAEWE